MRQRLEKAIEAIPVPKNGLDGRDALDLDDLELIQSEDGRTVTLSFKRGDVVIEKSFIIPCIIDQGVWRHEKPYVKGDGVTFAGAYWIAKREQPGKPGDGDGWRLSVKKGRDGKDAVAIKAEPAQ